MALPFLQSAQGDPSRSQRRIAGQAALGKPVAPTSWRDVCQNGGPIAITKSEVERRKIGSTGILPGKRLIDPFSWALGDVNPVDYGLLHVLANLFGWYNVANPSGSIYRWRYDRGTVGDTAASSYVQVLNDSDLVPRTWVYDGLVTGFQISAAPNDNFLAAADMIFGGYHFWDDGVQVTGTGSDVPTIIGARFIPSGGENQVFVETSPEQLWVELQAVSGSDLTIRCGAGTSQPTYSNTQSYTLGDEPLILQDENGVRIGPLSDPVKFYMPSGATVATGDEFTFDARRDRWPATLATDRAIPTINTQVFKDGASIRVENGYDLDISWPNSELKADTSGAQGATPRRTGDLTGRLNLDREIADLDFVKSLHENTTVSVVMEGETDAAISGTTKFRFLVVMPECEVVGSLYDVEEDGENTNEPVSLVARTPSASMNWDVDGDTLTFAEAVSVVLVNNVSAL